MLCIGKCATTVGVTKEALLGDLACSAASRWRGRNRVEGGVCGLVHHPSSEQLVRGDHQRPSVSPPGALHPWLELRNEESSHGCVPGIAAREVGSRSRGQLAASAFEGPSAEGLGAPLHFAQEELAARQGLAREVPFRRRQPWRISRSRRLISACRSRNFIMQISIMQSGIIFQAIWEGGGPGR